MLRQHQHRFVLGINNPVFGNAQILVLGALGHIVALPLQLPRTYHFYHQGWRRHGQANRIALGQQLNVLRLNHRQVRVAILRFAPYLQLKAMPSHSVYTHHQRQDEKQAIGNLHVLP